MISKKFFTVLIFITFLNVNLVAQIKNYSFSQNNLSYSAITDGTVLWSGSFDDEISGPVSITPFVFAGYQYSEIYISANGFVSFGKAPLSFNYNPISDTASYEGSVSVLGTDLESATAGNPEVRYQEIGNEIIIQWQDVKRFNSTGERLSAQIRLNHQTNAVSFVYGGTITPGSETVYFEVGLRGRTNNFNTDVNNRRIASNGGNWINSLAGITNLSTMFFNSSNPSTVPSPGLTFTWTAPDFPPAILYSPLSNFTGFENRVFENVQIIDYDGNVATGSVAPRVYWRVNSGAWQSSATISSGNPYDFIIGTTGLQLGDIVEYFIIAQDFNGNIRAVPGNGLNATSVNNITSFPTDPYSYLIIDLPMSGDYTIGVNLFRVLTGLELTFEKKTTLVEKDISQTLYELDPLKFEEIGYQIAHDNFENENLSYRSYENVSSSKQKIEIENIVPVLNGIEYRGNLYRQFTSEEKNLMDLRDGVGVYPTIGSAIDDITLRGVTGPVRLILLDTNYPSESFPIIINPIPGATETNSITLLPSTGVTSEISGNVNNSIIELNGVRHFTIEGRQNGISNTGSLTFSNLSNTSQAHTLRFLNGARNNTIQFVNLNNSSASTAGPRTIEFGTSITGIGNSDNLISNNILTGGRTGVGFSGTLGVNNSNNIIEFCHIKDFGYSGIWLLSNSENTIIRGNEIYHTNSGVNSAVWGIQFGSNFGINEIYRNKIYNIRSTSNSTVRGIQVSPAAGGVCNIYNNFVSLTEDNGTKTSVFGIQCSGSADFSVNVLYNSIRIGGVHTGGTSGSITSSGFVKSNSGSNSSVNFKNNIILNNRTGGNVESFRIGGYVANTSGNIEFDYNTYWGEGTSNSFSAGWNGVFYNVLTDYKAASFPNEQNTNFKTTEFASAIDLHLAGSSIGDLDLIATPIVWITRDIDDDIRSEFFPYKGADEVDVPLPVTEYGNHYIENEIPLRFNLYQNYPNPFNPETKIVFEIPVDADVKLVVYDIQGRVLDVLLTGRFKPGFYIVNYDGSKLSSGVYFYRLITNHSVITRKMLIVK